MRIRVRVRVRVRVCVRVRVRVRVRVCVYVRRCKGRCARVGERCVASQPPDFTRQGIRPIRPAFPLLHFTLLLKYPYNPNHSTIDPGSCKHLIRVIRARWSTVSRVSRLQARSDAAALSREWTYKLERDREMLQR